MIRYILLILLSIPSYGQSTFIKGIIKNGKTNIGIPHAHIYSATNPLNGSISNVDGYFAVKFSNSDKIVFSHIGYVTKKIDIKRLNTQKLEIKLTPKTTKLSEVSVLANKITANDIIKSVIENLKVNHSVEPVTYDFHTTLVNFAKEDSTVHLLEEYHGSIHQKRGMFNAISSQYYIEKCRIGAFSEVGRDKIKTHRIISADKMKIDNIFKYLDDYLHKRKHKIYNYRLIDRTVINNNKCYVIEYHTDERTTYKTGKLYIDMDDYAVVRKILENSEGNFRNRVDFRKNEKDRKWYLASAIDYHPLYQKPSADLRYTIYYQNESNYDLSLFKPWSPRDFVIDYADDFKDEFWGNDTFIPLPIWIRKQIKTIR